MAFLPSLSHVAYYSDGGLSQPGVSGGQPSVVLGRSPFHVVQKSARQHFVKGFCIEIHEGRWSGFFSLLS